MLVGLLLLCGKGGDGGGDVGLAVIVTTIMRMIKKKRIRVVIEIDAGGQMYNRGAERR